MAQLVPPLYSSWHPMCAVWRVPRCQVGRRVIVDCAGTRVSSFSPTPQGWPCVLRGCPHTSCPAREKSIKVRR